ncbi:hypothetical protein [Bacillus cereus]|uniref:hypothetical protein n=1 Tax=Bacillus cereus TaxID=1396 RepID=UPI001879C7A2|nr:hypothetical protein [Bacillus cereus]MBE7122994.1 hypothetical protein [Bacillus cereus]
MDYKKRGTGMLSSLQRKQPFERDKNDFPLMRIVLHTSSHKDKILNDEDTIISLLQLDEFPFLEVYLTPTNDKEILEKLGEKQSLIVKYDELERGVHIYNRTLNKSFGYSQDVDLNEGAIENSSVSLIDLLIGRYDYFDFFVIDEGDTFFRSRRKKGQDVTLQEVLNYVRVLLVNYGIFKVFPNYTVNEGLYYRYRIQKVFPMYQRAWGIVCANRREGKVFEQLDSLSRRLEFLLRAQDKVQFFELKTVNNDTQDIVLYHLAYFIILITGVFDDLAWIIHSLYSFKLDNKHQIKLRMDFDENRNQFKDNKFFNELSNSNRKLFMFLRKPDIQSFINWVYPFRDTIQHREFLHGIRYSNANEDFEGSLFSIPNEALEKVKLFNINLSEWGIEEFPHSSFFNAYVFVENALEKLSFIVNNSLDLIDWKNHYNIPNDIPKDVFGGEKPIYF